jgi:hypothetical protein
MNKETILYYLVIIHRRILEQRDILKGIHGPCQL